MTSPTKALIEYLRKIDWALDGDWLRQMVQQFAQAVIELEAEQVIGAGRYECSPQRTTRRNGYRERAWATRVGELELRIPKLGAGSFFPSLLEPRRRADRALLAVVQEAYLEGVSTHKSDEWAADERRYFSQASMQKLLDTLAPQRNLCYHSYDTLVPYIGTSHGTFVQPPLRDLANSANCTTRPILGAGLTTT